MKLSNLILFLLFVTSVFSQNNNGTDIADASLSETTSTITIDEKSIITVPVIIKKDIQWCFD